MTTQELPQGPSASPPGPALARMINGYWLTQMISTATRLGIADALAGGPQTAGRLAHRCGAHRGRSDKMPFRRRWASRISSAVESQPRQASVMDTP